MKTTSRRNFLSSVANSALTVSLLPAFGSEIERSSPADGKLRVAIMGLGSYGNRVAEAMLNCKRAVLTGLISGSPEK